MASRHRSPSFACAAPAVDASSVGEKLSPTTAPSVPVVASTPCAWPFDLRVNNTLASESGASLKASGWKVDATLPARSGFTCKSRPRDDDDRSYGEAKVRWIRHLDACDDSHTAVEAERTGPPSPTG